MLSRATYPSLQASFTNSSRINKESVSSLSACLNIEKYLSFIHRYSFRDNNRSFANIPGTFRDVRETFQDVHGIFRDVPGSFTGIHGTIQDIPVTFQDVQETFRDDNKAFGDNNKSTNCAYNIQKNERVKLTDSLSALENVRITIPITHRLVKNQGDAMNILFNKKVEAI